MFNQRISQTNTINIVTEALGLTPRAKHIVLLHHEHFFIVRENSIRFGHNCRRDAFVRIDVSITYQKKK